jgi:ABC-2 type transport system permease protein
MNSVTLLSTWTLYKKEVLRFLKVYHQTLLSPVVSALTFLFIFSLSLEGRIHDINGVPFIIFVASGLIIMSITQNAFSNPSSSLIMSKVMGTIIDYIIPPIPINGFIIAYIGAGVTRGIMVGVMVYIALSFFVDLYIYDYFILIFFTLLATILLSLIGIITSIVSNSFDQVAAITTYVVTPLSFLSGTFYSIKNLPPLLIKIDNFNPFFYMIDGFRYGMLGIKDSSPFIGAGYLIFIIIICYSVLYLMLRKGYKIKS